MARHFTKYPSDYVRAANDNYKSDEYVVIFNGESYGAYDGYEFAVSELKTMINEAIAINGPMGVELEDCYVADGMDYDSEIVYVASNDPDYL